MFVKIKDFGWERKKQITHSKVKFRWINIISKLKKYCIQHIMYFGITSCLWENIQIRKWRVIIFNSVFISRIWAIRFYLKIEWKRKYFNAYRFDIGRRFTVGRKTLVQVIKSLIFCRNKCSYTIKQNLN